MQKIFYTFLICLISFNFYSCNKDETTNPYVGIWNIYTKQSYKFNVNSTCTGTLSITENKDKVSYKLIVDSETLSSGVIEEDKMYSNDVYFGKITLGNSTLSIETTNSYIYTATISSTGSNSGNSGTSTSQQCAATTQKGTRCKRNADKGSIYCWQHKK